MSRMSSIVSHLMPATPLAAPTLSRLAALKPTTIALMHGPSFKGDGGAALTALATYYANGKN